MRPDDRPSAFGDLLDHGLELPFDADLESLDAELAAAGRLARRMLNGRTQPTRLFSTQLRAHLLGATAPPRAATAGRRPEVQAPAAGGPLGPGGMALEQHAPIPRASTRATFTAPARTLLAILAIASMAGVLALGAINGTFGPPLP